VTDHQPAWVLVLISKVKSLCGISAFSLSPMQTLYPNSPEFKASIEYSIPSAFSRMDRAFSDHCRIEKMLTGPPSTRSFYTPPPASRGAKLCSVLRHAYPVGQ